MTGRKTQKESPVMAVPLQIKPRYGEDKETGTRFDTCPKCGEKFHYNEEPNLCYKCPSCLTRPERLIVYIPAGWTKNNQSAYLYTTPDGQPLDGLGAAIGLYNSVEIARQSSNDGKIDVGQFKLERLKSQRWNAFIKEKWIPDIENDKNLKPSTVATYKYRAIRYIVPHFGNKDMRATTEGDIVKFKNSLKGSDNHIQGTIKVLKLIYKKAKKWEKIPMPDIELLKIEKKVVRLFKQGQLNLIMPKILGQHKDIFTFLPNTGVRQSEAFGLRLPNIDFEKKQAIIKDNLYKGVLMTTKGKVQRIVPLNIFVDLMPMLKKLYDAAEDKEGYVFRYKGSDGKERPYRAEILWYAWRKATKHITRLNVHALRAHFATELYKIEPDKEYVRAVLGHEDWKTTEAYLEAVDIEERTLKLIKKVKGV